jgi:uncharacterized membrane protein HdeD (DUF308 family)
MDTATRQISHAYWWLIILRAVVALLFGIMALISAEFTLLFLVYLFGAYVLLDGILAIIVSLQERSSSSRWWVLFLLGIVGIIVGVLSFIHPGNVALVIFYLVGIWLIISGIFGILSAFTLRAAGGEGLLVIGGIISIIVGIIFLIRPTSSILTIVWLLGVFALVYGIIQIVRAIQLRSLLSA